MGRWPRAMEGVGMTHAFSGVFMGRRVLVTGHTGFKGSWLCQWLLDLGAQIHGIALAPATDPALFDVLNLKQRIDHRVLDIRDGAALRSAVAAIEPELVFHLAAQPLVRLSYREPAETWATNVLGTVHLLESIRACATVRACVVVTSDKCYENREQLWGYRESDAMGGHDPYSSSKGATELAVASWRRSFFHAPTSCRLASARAGNVIGGGDWATDRIVTDFVSAIRRGQPLTLRNPLATRPWQHVLEPLSGYLNLAAHLVRDDGQMFADGWNFGPAETSVVTVELLARALAAEWGAGTVRVEQDPTRPHEAGLLKLDGSKAAARLGWRSIWDMPTTLRHTVAWYKTHADGASSESLRALTHRQITEYSAEAARLGMPWATLAA